jgi:hypothetical protein
MGCDHRHRPFAKSRGKVLFQSLRQGLAVVARPSRYRTGQQRAPLKPPAREERFRALPIEEAEHSVEGRGLHFQRGMFPL